MANSAQHEAFWSMESDQLFAQLNSSPIGLTQSAAENRDVRANRLKAHRASAWSLLIDQLRNPILVLLFCSAVLSFTLLDDKTNAVIIIVILMETAMITPPVGINLYVVQGLRKRGKIDDVIIGAAITDDEAKTLFPNGWKTVKPYLRVVPQPK